MGYIADLHYDMALQQKYEIQNEIAGVSEEYTDEELYSLTDESDEELIMSIREYFSKYKKLSEKQRYCLARNICEQS